ncbi:hypothetical protein [Mesonia aquimarina]|uniref:hypothetical protein n=1 Tax=Mesonia aquimarina TaxID=1504967 RepID=UPI000EF5D769|nr:hypothetical protein [Mesonia aquimarina]
MKALVVILILLINVAFGQQKISIDKNLEKYEINDDFERFDDIEKPEQDFKELILNAESAALFQIINTYHTGFGGYEISFTINSVLEIKELSYNYWTDNINIDNPTTYKVNKADLLLNQNPFNSTKGLRGAYHLEIGHYKNDCLIKTQTFKGKFKTFKGIDEQAAAYKWVLEQNKYNYAKTNSDGVYLNPSRLPSLQSDSKLLIQEIKKIKGHIPHTIKAYVIINEEGKIEKEPIRYAGQLDNEVKRKITNLLVELTRWSPACEQTKEVKSQIPIEISID